MHVQILESDHTSGTTQATGFIYSFIMYLICVQYISINSSHLAVNHPFPDPFLSGPGTPSRTFFVNLKRTITLPEPVYDHVNFGYALRKVFFSHSAWGQINMVIVHPIIWSQPQELLSSY